MSAREYSKFPTKGHNAEKNSAERNDARVYHTEYKKAEKSAAKEDADCGHKTREMRKIINAGVSLPYSATVTYLPPIRVAPNSPLVPRSIA